MRHSIIDHGSQGAGDWFSSGGMMARDQRQGRDKALDSPAEPPVASTLASPLDGTLGYRLRRASMAMMGDVIAALRAIDLSVGEASLLILVGHNPGCRQSDVGRALAIKRANLTPLIGRLKARDLISDAPIDGRSLSLTLTPQGEALQREAMKRVKASNRKFQKRLTIEEKALLAALEALG
ncbi:MULTISPECIES: MarR family winged helix-turn-helix transcriptional regulator [unclassified Sphingobium]|uniref:MarR family winged helix-turn-helix transcriptional regulator n=1 Tax=unclassified Sphingobium TaxID=2611147 RepID=UPI00222454B6|nr:MULTISPECIES: MarR family transcriptional regulator [unclassified Sphingobium]MCW2412234.1 DNA-binding MarR family transcriptional regulator [Sphingobium sp. B8D3D]MCW2415469.1 DNA-binding MarR family transcriptional regulator [Sphingobium sp. B8D3A]